MEDLEFYETFSRDVTSGKHEDLSIQDRLPNKINWLVDNEEFSIACDQGLIAKQFRSNILVIEAPYDLEKNSAYLVTVKGQLISSIPKKYDCVSLTFYDILTSPPYAILLAASTSGDFQLTIDPRNGTIHKSAPFR
ncbi:hypothetical protein [Limnobacter sp.]|uniref:hypothetical protein n=1 Tax=Limnobacter sp. TaxID=2003368 RepID=UPI003511E8A8